MPYDRVLADRIRDSLAHLPSVREVNMFGGLSFLVNGKMAVNANTHGDLMIRCDPDHVDDLLDRDGVQLAEMGKRWLRVQADGIEGEADLDFWIEEALEFNATETK